MSSMLDADLMTLDEAAQIEDARPSGHGGIKPAAPSNRSMSGEE
jgi:hypothetical protein